MSRMFMDITFDGHVTVGMGSTGHSPYAGSFKKGSGIERSAFRMGGKKYFLIPV